MTKVSKQATETPQPFKLGHLKTLNQIVKGLSKTIRAMADGSLDSQVGARICNGLGIMRACVETQALERIDARLQRLEENRGESEGQGFTPGRLIDLTPERTWPQ